MCTCSYLLRVSAVSMGRLGESWSFQENSAVTVGVSCNPFSMGLGQRMVKELDLKLTLGMAETESPPDEESWGGCQV